MLYNPPSGSTDPNASYVGKDTASGRQGSKLPPAVPENTQREIVAIISAAQAMGMPAPTNADVAQMLKAVRSSLLGRYPATGTPDALAIAPIPAVAALVEGMRFRFKVPGSAANATTAPTLTINGIASAIKRRTGVAPAIGDIVGGTVHEAEIDAAGNARLVGAVASDINVVISARPAVTTVWIDPTNGNDANDGSTPALARQSIDTVISGMNSNATLINLLGNATMRQRVNVLAPLTIQGVDTSGNFVARTLSFLGTADNSGGALGTTCSGMFFNGPLLRTGYINYFLPDIPSGYNYRSHIISLGNSAVAMGNAVITANSSQSGALFGFQTARLTVTVAAVTYSAALGRVFDGIGANGNPNNLYNYTTNITSA